MQQHTVENLKTGVTRYYIDGKRVNRSTYEHAAFWRRIDCIHGKVSKTHRYCYRSVHK